MLTIKYLHSSIFTHENSLVQAISLHKTSYAEIKKLMFQGKYQEIPYDIYREIIVLDTLKNLVNISNDIDKNSNKYYAYEIVEDLINYIDSSSEESLEEILQKTKVDVDNSMSSYEFLPTILGVGLLAKKQSNEKEELKHEYEQSRGSKGHSKEEDFTPPEAA